MERPGSEHELGQFIPLHYHFNMLNDVARTGAFEEAIARTVRPGARVLELGGGTGVMSFFAARRAGHVWCVERNPAVARETRRLLALNDCAETVEVVEADALDYVPPEPVDVVVCEMLHVTLLVEKQIPVIAAFKENYLAATPSAPGVSRVGAAPRRPTSPAGAMVGVIADMPPGTLGPACPEG